MSHVLRFILIADRYMAPEVLDTQAYNYKVDVFSLGVVMWEVSQQN